MKNTPHKYALGIVNTTSSEERNQIGQTEIISWLTQDQYVQFKTSMIDINFFRNNRRLREMVVHNHNQIFEFGDFLFQKGMINNEGKGDLSGEDLDMLYLVANTRLANYLSSVYAIQEHNKAFFKKISKKGGDQDKIYESYIEQLIKENQSFDFMMLLRHYTQHLGWPIQTIYLLKSKVNDVFLSINMLCNKERLVESFKWPSTLNSFFDSLDINFQFFPHMAITSQIVDKIAIRSEELNLIRSNAAADYIFSLTDGLRNKGTRIFIFTDIQIEDSSQEIMKARDHEIIFDTVDIIKNRIDFFTQKPIS